MRRGTALFRSIWWLKSWFREILRKHPEIWVEAPGWRKMPAGRILEVVAIVSDDILDDLVVFDKVLTRVKLRVVSWWTKVGAWRGRT